jgi:hypothetical protein
MAKTTAERDNGVDIISARDELEEANPGLKQSYREFLTSFAKFREMENQFKGKGPQSAPARRKGQLRG